MLSWLNVLRSGPLEVWMVAVRLACAVLCGGIIGIERERKRRPAGFRTHILICLGAALATLTSQYLTLNLGLRTDMARLGAQVVAGIGFIGAGTIIVTKRRQVKGLTTAAGLWASAIVGLCIGAGFFEAAIFATLVIMIAELVFSKLEYLILSNTRTFNLYVEYAEGGTLSSVVDTIKKQSAHIVDMEITKSGGNNRNPCVILSIKTPRKISHSALMTTVSKLDGVVTVEEL